jgi:hypothetical protein
MGDDLRFWEAAALASLHARLTRGEKGASLLAVADASALCAERKKRVDRAREDEELERRAARS